MAVITIPRSLAGTKTTGLAREPFLPANQRNNQTTPSTIDCPALALDQGVGAVVWSPLGWGRLTGKLRRGQPLPESSRLQSQRVRDNGPPIADEYLYRVVDALDEVAEETGKTVPQVALNWLLRRPTVTTVIIGARHEEQLRDNLGAVGWELTAAQIAKLDAASSATPAYPYWHQAGFAERNPPPVAKSPVV